MAAVLCTYHLLVAWKPRRYLALAFSCLGRVAHPCGTPTIAGGIQRQGEASFSLPVDRLLLLKPLRVTPRTVPAGPRSSPKRGYAVSSTTVGRWTIRPGA